MEMWNRSPPARPATTGGHGKHTTPRRTRPRKGMEKARKRPPAPRPSRGWLTGGPVGIFLFVDGAGGGPPVGTRVRAADMVGAEVGPWCQDRRATRSASAVQEPVVKERVGPGIIFQRTEPWST